MKIMVLNGPNLNMVGIREKGIYGELSFESIIQEINAYAKEKGIEVDARQSNHEGDLVDWLQEAYFGKYDGVIINPGAYTHTSIALLDAAKAIAPLPVIEVHLSDINEREDFRKVSYISMACKKQIKGLGSKGYLVAIDTLLEELIIKAH